MLSVEIYNHVQSREKVFVPMQAETKKKEEEEEERRRRDEAVFTWNIHLFITMTRTLKNHHWRTATAAATLPKPLSSMRGSGILIPLHGSEDC
jgi:hypothetical protein